jgi:hypothetical protein
VNEGRCHHPAPVEPNKSASTYRLPFGRGNTNGLPNGRLPLLVHVGVGRLQGGRINAVTEGDGRPAIPRLNPVQGEIFLRLNWRGAEEQGNE